MSPETDGGALAKISMMHLANRQFNRDVGWGTEHWEVINWAGPWGTGPYRLTVDREHQRQAIRQMERRTHDQAYFLFLYNPIQLFTVNKAVEFVPYVSTLLKLAETGVMAQHWSVQQGARKE